MESRYDLSKKAIDVLVAMYRHGLSPKQLTQEIERISAYWDELEWNNNGLDGYPRHIRPSDFSDTLVNIKDWKS